MKRFSRSASAACLFGLFVACSGPAPGVPSATPGPATPPADAVEVSDPVARVAPNDAPVVSDADWTGHGRDLTSCFNGHVTV